MRIVHLLKITNIRILHLFNEGDLNESYISYNYSFYIYPSCVKGIVKNDSGMRKYTGPEFLTIYFVVA